MELTTTFELTLTPAESSPAHDTLVFGQNGPVGDVLFISIVTQGDVMKWQNPSQIIVAGKNYGNLDVNNDGMISCARRTSSHQLLQCV